jgi:hypothetical protein
MATVRITRKFRYRVFSGGIYTVGMCAAWMSVVSFSAGVVCLMVALVLNVAREEVFALEVRGHW